MELRANHFHSKGKTAYVRGRQYELRKAIKAKYADSLSKASLLERLFLRFEMWCELSQAKKEDHKAAHKPSPSTLW